MASATPFLSSRLEKVFNACFGDSLRTRLVGGADEPFYQPAASTDQYHTLYYRSDYFASALHEVAHWCVAGPQRRLLPDFGYWYAADGRDAKQQADFEAVESKPQALEWFFSRACGYQFQVSADNLELSAAGKLDGAHFQSRVLEQALLWQQVGLPERASIFFEALRGEFGTTIPVSQVRFALADLAR